MLTKIFVNFPFFPVSTGLGGECEDNVQCSAKTPSSHCQENKCVCQQHMHGHNGSCYKTVGMCSNIF